MSQFLQQTIQRAKSDKQRIVLPEGNDVRTLDAAAKILELEIADIIIIGNPEEILSSHPVLNAATIIDPENYPEADDYANCLYELRKAKGMSPEKARELLKDPLHLGVMLVYKAQADGMVSGACHSTADVLRPSLQILKTAPGTKLVSSFFIMDVPDCEYGEKGVFLFSDCGLNLYPNADELSEIALASAASFQSLVQAEPRVAMLSYSTLGSGKDVEKVIEATKLAKAKAPQLALDGELQLDAAIVPSVAAAKAGGSSVAGRANVLIFPDLNAGNIGYKLVQRLAKADAFGPVTQGLARPVNDLSRGCSADDIVGVVAITCVQSQARKAAAL